jgi:hypothetical protein
MLDWLKSIFRTWPKTPNFVALNTTDVAMPFEVMLVVEVSDSTARNDRLVKAPLYAKAGIPELWIVDLTTSETVVHRGPSEAGWADVVGVPFAGELVAGFDGAVRVVVCIQV